jgi:hypothetical protein
MSDATFPDFTAPASASPRGAPLYTIAKSFSFSASHKIEGLSADHPCSRLHGHNYEVEMILQSSVLDAVGFVRDYRELAALGRKSSRCASLRRQRHGRNFGV